MRRLSGQAIRWIGRWLHRVCGLLLTLTVLLTVAVSATAWRLSQGPVDIGWLSGRIEAAVNVEDDPTRLSIGGTALAWEGFNRGVDHPLELVLTDMRITDRGGGRQIEIARAEMTLSIGALFFGRIVPRSLDIDGARLTLLRAADGTVSLDVGTLREAADTAEAQATDSEPSALSGLLRELARPVTTDQSGTHGALSQLRRLRVRNAKVTVIDTQIGATWQAPHADIALSRRVSGGVDGTATIQLAMGAERADLILSAILVPGAAETTVRARLSPVAPAALARAAPGLAPLAALDAPVSFDGDIVLGAALEPLRGQGTLLIGAGIAHVAGGHVPFQRLSVTGSATPNTLTVDALEFVARTKEGGVVSRLKGSATVRRDPARYAATARLTLDEVTMADLPQYWPPEAGSKLRKWLTENITAGTFRNGTVDLALNAPIDLSDVEVTRATGGLDGEDIVATWLRPVPGVEQGKAQLRLLDPDTIEIAIRAGRQRTSVRGATIPLRNGRVRITGLTEIDQLAVIDIEAAAPLALGIALLKEPRLHLLDKYPMDLRDPAGDATVNLSVSVPLLERITLDDVAIKAKARLTQVHLTGIAAGRNIDQGNFDLEVTTDQLTLKGATLVAAIQAQIDLLMDFRPGPATKVLQRITASARPTAAQLTAAGLDSVDMLFGEVPIHAVLLERRNGEGEISIEADLTPSRLVVEPVAWNKPSGVAAKGAARVVLSKGKVRTIDRIAIDGAELSVRGTADVVDNKIATIRLERALLGKTDVKGTIRIPANAPIAIDLHGPALNLAPKIMEKSPKTKGPPPTGPAWALEGQFARVSMANAQVFTDTVASIRHDGRLYRDARITARTGPNATASIRIEQTASGRTLTVSAADAGSLLRGVDAFRTIDGGNMTLTGRFDDADPASPLNGEVRIEEFRVRGAVGLGKLLQAMTLYGLVDVLSGPGLGFSRLVVPLRFDDDGLLLTDARAFSASLGLTAKGRINMDDDKIDIEGTIVPAYFFNSLLGNIPLLGKLFSPEEGGGLFAARYSLRGKLEDPSVFVNPLSALTPGFLREIFGIF